MGRNLLLLIVCGGVPLAPVHAGPSEDLKAGSEAFRQGDLDRALALLNAAAEGLPTSVEAHLALADCYLQAGRLTEAIARYRRVLELSPRHTRAQRVVDALTGRNKAFAEQIEGVRALMKLGAYASAQELLIKLIEEPIAAEDRSAARLLLAESRLWAGDSPKALQDSIRLAQDPGAAREAGPARVLAALALLNEPAISELQVKELIQNAKGLAPLWADRVKVVELVLQNQDPSKASVVSSRLNDALNSIPRGPYLTAMRNRLSQTMRESANPAAEKGNQKTVALIVWPMVSRHPFPDPGAIMKPISLEGGWLDEDATLGEILDIARLLITSSDQEMVLKGVDSRVLSFWIAAEILRQPLGKYLPRDGAEVQRVLAVRCAALGKDHFDRRSATLRPDANSELNAFDQLALTLFAQLFPHSSIEELHPVREIVQRYAGSSQWSAAIHAARVFHADLEARSLAMHRIKIQRATVVEDQMQAAGRQPGAGLIREMKEALTDLNASLQDASPRYRDRVLTMAEAILDRYAKVGRFDLANRIVDGFEKTASDWVAWHRAGLQGRQGDQRLPATPPGRPLALLDAHRAELKQLDELISKHPESRYTSPAVARVSAIAVGYRQRHAHDTAAEVLGDFVTTHPKLASVPAMEYQRVEILLARAEAELTAHSGEELPDTLSMQAEQAIDAILAFRKAYPSGELAANAQRELFKLAKVHARMKAWGLARGVLERYEKSLPAESALRELELMKSATYLGELDSTHGLTLLDQFAQLKPDPANAKPADGSRGDWKSHGKVIPRAYQILIGLLQAAPQEDAITRTRAREQILWMIGFLEGHGAPAAANQVLVQFLKDQPKDADLVALKLRVVANQFAEAARPAETNEPADWLAQRHQLFLKAREAAARFLADHHQEMRPANQAKVLLASSHEQEANLFAGTDPVRAGGLLVESARLWVGQETGPQLGVTGPQPGEKSFPRRAEEWTNRLLQLGQKDQAIQVLEMIPRFDPLAEEASKAYLRIAEIHAQDLANPLKAIEPYLVYVDRGNADAEVRNRLFKMARELAGQNRYLESLYLYRVFVERFPTDHRLAEALHALGQLFQANEVWASAIPIYQRILKEHPSEPVVAQVRRAMAQCHIHLGDWQQARVTYQQELAVRTQAPDAAQLLSRIEVLDQIQRYESLLADRGDGSNKADAQFQIGRLVRDKLDNPARAILEFQKVPEKYPGTAQADDAQLEVGRALLALDRAEEARKALLEVPTRYSGSPLADDALFLLGQSYEKEAQKLATLTVDVVRAEAQRSRQQDAFLMFTRQEELQVKKEQGSPMILGQPEADVLTSTLQSSLASTSADQLFCHVCEAEARAESESVLRVASRQDRINEAYREAVAMYSRAATDYPLGDSTDTSLSRMAHIFENDLKNQARAVQTYEQIVKLFPGTPLAEDAAWKLANFFVARREYDRAVEAYRDFIRNYPASARVADAQFGQAEVLQRTEKWVEAMDAYEIFLQKFGKHPHAARALEQINWIKTYRRK